jgi:hypothetical protein
MLHLCLGMVKGIIYYINNVQLESSVFFYNLTSLYVGLVQSVDSLSFHLLIGFHLII